MGHSSLPRKATKQLASITNTSPQKCAVFACSRNTQRSIGKGLSDNYCKYHIERVRRHGHTTRGSYQLQEILPYRRAAKQWLKAHMKDPYVRNVIDKLDSLIASSGIYRNAYSTQSISPKDKAYAALARLRVEGHSGGELMEAVITAKAAYNQLGPRGYPEFLLVQIAKLIHRLASGTRIRNSNGLDWQKYPRPEGRYMRILGRMVEDIAGIIATPEVIQEIIHLARPN